MRQIQYTHILYVICDKRQQAWCCGKITRQGFTDRKPQQVDGVLLCDVVGLCWCSYRSMPCSFILCLSDISRPPPQAAWRVQKQHILINVSPLHTGCIKTYLCVSVVTWSHHMLTKGVQYTIMHSVYATHIHCDAVCVCVCVIIWPYLILSDCCQRKLFKLYLK